MNEANKGGSAHVVAINEHVAKLAELEAKHGPCAHLVKGGKLFVWRTPTLDEWEDAQEQFRNDKVRRGPAFRELAQKTLVHPSVEELQTLFQKKPAVAALVSDAVSKLAGVEEEIVVKKD